MIRSDIPIHDFNEVIKSSPIDQVARRVTAPGWHYEREGKNAHHSKEPIPFITWRAGENLTGVRFGRMKVLGVFAAPSKKGRRWVVQCLCGNFEIRYAKAIKNPLNEDDCCSVCRQVKYLKRYYGIDGKRPSL